MGASEQGWVEGTGLADVECRSRSGTYEGLEEGGGPSEVVEVGRKYWWVLEVGRSAKGS